MIEPAVAKAAAKSEPRRRDDAPVFNQSHWRAVEAILAGLREGRAVMVLAGGPEAGAEAVAAEALSATDLVVAETGAGSTLAELFAPARAALAAAGVEAPELGAPDGAAAAEALRPALERLAEARRGLALVVAPQTPLTDQALAFLVGLARISAALIGADASEGRARVGARVILAAPEEAMADLEAFGDLALSAAAADPARLAPFDETSLRAAFRQRSGARLSAGAATYAQAVTGGAQTLVEALFREPRLNRYALVAWGADAAPVVSAQRVAAAAAALGLPAPEGLDPARLDVVPAKAAQETAQETARETAGQAPDAILVDLDALTASVAACAEAWEARDILAEIDADEDPEAPASAEAGDAFAEDAELSDLLAEGGLEAPADAPREGLEDPLLGDAPAPLVASAPSSVFEIDRARLFDGAPRLGSRGRAAATLLAVIGVPALAAALFSVLGPASRGAPPAPAAAHASPPETAERAADDFWEESAVRRDPPAERWETADAPEKPEEPRRAAPERLAMATRPTSPALDFPGAEAAARRDALAAEGAAKRADALAEPSLWTRLADGALSAAEEAVRAASPSAALADDLFDARGELVRGDAARRLAALPEAEREAALEALVAKALADAEAYRGAGRFALPAGESAYDALLSVYPLAPADPRVQGALAGLVDHYEGEARQALAAQRYAAFHEHNRIADRIRARKPL